jgi:peptide maturation system acyl carrier-related protein
MSEGVLNATTDVESRLNQLFRKRLKLEISDQNVLLLGTNAGLTARDLVYVCLDIEKEFGVSIDDECIKNYYLTTFANIKNFILSRINH